MAIKRKFLQNIRLAFISLAVFSFCACEAPQVNQASRFVSKNDFVKTSNSTSTNAYPAGDSAANAAVTAYDSSDETLRETKFDAAAAQNAKLKSNLQWTFGGKSQTGWYLYEELISQLLETKAKAETVEFAEALAAWQKKNSLAPSGILDEPALMAIVKYWQANRLKTRGFAAPEDLTVAPPADFYDPYRVEELRQLEKRTFAAYKKMVAAAVADKSLNLETDGKGNLASKERFLKIVSAFRSRDYQEKLRRESPNSGRAGLAVNNSPHFTGRALDIYVGGDPVDTKDANRLIQVETPVYKWLVKNAARFGFKPYFYEPWHWEYAPEAEN